MAKEICRSQSGIEQLETVFDNMFDAVIILDVPMGEIVYANQALCAMYGYSPSEVLQLTIPELSSGEPHESLTMAMDSLSMTVHGSARLLNWKARKKDGALFWTETSLQKAGVAGKELVIALVRDITDRKRMEVELERARDELERRVEERTAELRKANDMLEREIAVRKRTESVIMARLRLLQLAGTHSLDELLQATLDEAEALTGSLIGFYHFLKADQETLSLQNWSTRTMAEFCKAKGKGSHYDLAAAGVWVDCIHERGPVIHNDYASLPHRKGMPPEHAQVVRELVVPVFRGDKIMAILGVGNKPLDYTSEDVETVSLLADLAWEITERKRMEEELLLSRFCIDKAAIGIYHTSPEGTILYANDFACRSLGYTADELCALKVPDIDPVLTDEKTLEIKRLLDTAGAVTHETVHRRKDGTTFPVEIVTNALVFHGKSYGFSFVKDITEHKRAEEQLRENLKLLQTMVRNVPIVLYGVDRNGVFTFSEGKGLAGMGLKPGGYVGRSVFDVYRGMPEYLENFSRALAGEAFTAPVHAGDHIYDAYHEPVFGSDGEYAGTLGVLVDVTEQRRVEEALRDANLVVENSPVVLFRWKGDDEWAVELVSGNIMQFGYTPDEFLSGSITYSAIIHPDDLERVTREVHDFCNQGVKQFCLEYRNMTKGGEIRWVNEHTNVELDAAGCVKNFEGIVIDITERKLAEEELKRQRQLLQELNETLENRVEEEVAKNREKDIMLIQQNRQAALGEMLDHITHQWKQPLNCIYLIIQGLRETASASELTDELVEATVSKTMALLEHMSQTIDVFRGFYRPDKEKKVFSVKDSINQALAFIAPAFKFQSIAAELDVDPGLTAFGYPKEFAQALLNILANARDVFRARGTEKPGVILRAFAEDDKTVVTIMDNAGGIPETIKDKVFDFYFTTNESSGGTGIGLYMSKNIIENNMGGTLSAENTDGGAQFRIEIPTT